MVPPPAHTLPHPACNSWGNLLSNVHYLTAPSADSIPVYAPRCEEQSIRFFAVPQGTQQQIIDKKEIPWMRHNRKKCQPNFGVYFQRPLLNLNLKQAQNTKSKQSPLLKYRKLNSRVSKTNQ